MPPGKGAASVLVATHLPTDFQGDVKSDSRMDSHSSHTLSVSQSLLLAGKAAAHNPQ